MMKNFIQRAITGILFVAVLVGCIIGGPLSFGFLFCLISALATFEFCNLVNRQEEVSINRNICTLGSIFLFFCFFYYGINPAETGIFIPYLALLIYLLVSELYLKKKNPINNWAYSMMSQLYVGLPFALLNVLAFQNNMEISVSQYVFILPLSVFIFNWINDTGAYCTGMLFGKHRLFERISPKKSWEGSIGGAVFSILAGFALSYLFPIMSTWQWIGMALTVVVFGTWGDLTESLMKRHLGIKDSGNILPGHGGLLDRFDSTLMAVPAAVVYLYIVSLF
ncbi:MAG: phosphatidate cytidylyltransferase [Bacteroides sp.]|nr:phosphatidate cytidylyltransferase [Bacteroidaceae bacterium]MBQ8875743.1 phosphatidate cytidylyltransferase [Bacteroides sp.]